jgi:SAM-dependent methyltransferase
MAVTVTGEYLERTQYSVGEVLENEKLFGRNYYSAGGEEEVLHMLRLCEPIRPRRILDVGSGLGGPTFLLAKRYGVPVDGIEITRSMCDLARERLVEQGLDGQVRFIHGDVLSFEPGVVYDLVFSKNVFSHIHDKDRLLDRIRDLLAEGGVFLFCDNCGGVDGEEMRAHSDRFGYHIPRMDEWTEMLAARGFQEVAVEDGTARFAAYCERSLRTDGINDDWRGVLEKRLGRIARGEHRWGLFCYRR